MPNTKSAEKRLRQNKKRRMRNRIAKKILKTFSKRSVSAAAEGKEGAETDFRLATAKIDRAGAHRVLHPNTANRRKSKLARDYAAALNKAQAKKSASA